MSSYKMDFSKLLSQIDSVNTKKTYDNDSADYWKPTKDKAGNAAAIIRFLPSKNIEDFPFVRIWSHSFKDKGTGHWYIENSLSTIGKQDYISEVNKELWNTGIEENKKLASYRKRKLQYISNIYVVKDLGNPENNGKVFKYKYGSKIWEKIVAAAKPEEALGEEPVMAFDPVEGADFILKMAYVNEQYNYDASKFGAKKPLFDNDKDLEEVLAQCHDMNLETAPEKFKTEAELKSKFLWVTGQKDTASGVSAAKKQEFDEGDAELAELEKLASAKPPAKKPAEAAKPARKTAPPMPVDTDNPTDDDDSAFFKSLID